MNRMLRSGAAAGFLLLLITGANADAPPVRSGNAVFDKAVEMVNQYFHDPAALPKFNAAVAGEVAKGVSDPNAAIADVLPALGASHMGHYTRDELAYYELADIFRFNFRKDLARLFPPQGRISYPGIGIATEVIGGKRFVTDVYDGAPAALAGIETGDEILSVDGAPFSEIDAFRGKVGKTATLTIRRTADAEPKAYNVEVRDLEPSDTFIDAIGKSARVVERGGRKIGYLHVWFYGRGDVTDAIGDALASEPLASADALVVDLRGRWGGAPPDAAETFLGGTPPFTFIDRDGKRELSNMRWHKPLVGLIDEGTRSGLEVYAYALQQKGVPLVGTRTAGALLGARGYLLPDDSLLEIAVAGVELDGKVLEGKGVTPDVTVPFDLRYAAGHDPQLDAALDRAAVVAGDG
jgi:C-terminal processing protease CtpA/Prc